MIPENLKSLLVKVTEMTIQGKISWSTTSMKGKYQLVLSDEFLTIRQTDNEHDASYEFQILKEDGTILYSHAESEHETAYPVFKALYDAVVSSISSAQGILDSVMRALDNEG